jgi:hypothetical protein
MTREIFQSRIPIVIAIQNCSSTKIERGCLSVRNPPLGVHLNWNAEVSIFVLVFLQKIVDMSGKGKLERVLKC